MYPNLFYSSCSFPEKKFLTDPKISCLRNVQNFIEFPKGFSFYKDSLRTF